MLIDVIKEQDGPDTLFYLDPPYLHETRAGGKDNQDYEYEMSATDHLAMLDLLDTCNGYVILSGYPSEMYDTALAGWTREEFRLPNNVAGGKSKRTMTEVIWKNF